VRSYVAGQTVVSQGEVLDEADVEALQELGLIQPESNWQDLVSAAALVLLMGVLMALYLPRVEALYFNQARGLALLAVLFLTFLVVARITIPTHVVLPYIFPLAAYSLTVMALFGAELAMVTALPLAILTSYSLPNALDLTFYYLLGSLFGVLVLGGAQRITAFFRAGATIVISGSIVILVFRLSSTDTVGLATLIGAAAFNGLASAGLAVLLQFFLAQFLGMVSPMQLMELTRPDHPLLKRLLNEAPGTYQHSLQLANLAEQAAERVGADPLLTRVGALYHDIGKALTPVFFIENQVPGFTNPHDSLDPLESSGIILSHITDGLELGQEYRLPRRILDFIAEHHGTMVTRYQYITAVKAAGGDDSQVDKEQFRYPGPRPQSRETAILMLADGCEARVRAERPASEEELAVLIRSVIDARMASGQLDDTDLTLRELTEIQESFVATLRGIYHPRVKYPKLDSAPSSQVEESLDSQVEDIPIELPVETPSDLAPPSD
jgi:putative nucleotidyltransferase with HDIG domain